MGHEQLKLVSPGCMSLSSPYRAGKTVRTYLMFIQMHLYTPKLTEATN